MIVISNWISVITMTTFGSPLWEQLLTETLFTLVQQSALSLVHLHIPESEDVLTKMFLCKC